MHIFIRCYLQSLVLAVKDIVKVEMCLLPKAGTCHNCLLSLNSSACSPLPEFCLGAEEFPSLGSTPQPFSLLQLCCQRSRGSLQLALGWQHGPAELCLGSSLSHGGCRGESSVILQRSEYSSWTLVEKTAYEIKKKPTKKTYIQVRTHSIYFNVYFRMR